MRSIQRIRRREFLGASAAGGAAALLCNVALRTGKKLQWDPVNLKAANCPEADRFIRRAYRQGWTL